MQLIQDDFLDDVILQISQKLSNLEAENPQVTLKSDIQSFVLQELPEIELVEEVENSKQEDQAENEGEKDKCHSGEAEYSVMQDREEERSSQQAAI